MKRPWMPLYVADYLADTGHLTGAEHGAYLLLIMHYWANDGLPGDDRQLARIARMTDAQWKRSKPIIKVFFSDDWKHARIEDEMAEAERLSAAGRTGGKASGKARRERSLKTVEQSLPQPLNDPGNDSPTNCEPLQSQSQKKELRANARRARAKVPLPDCFDPHFEVAIGLGWARPKILQEFDKFRASALAHNRHYANWQAAWDNWCRSPFQQQNQQGNGHERGGKSLLAAIDRIAETLEGATDCEAGESPVLGLPPR